MAELTLADLPRLSLDPWENWRPLGLEASFDDEWDAWSQHILDDAAGALDAQEVSHG